jgi:2-oxoglutarate dehydrogenase E1 component
MDLNAQNLSYLEELFYAYQRDPASLPAEWRGYFSDVLSEPLPDGIVQPLPREQLEFLYRVGRLIEAYRERGHLAASLDPLGRPRPRPKELELEAHGLSQADLSRALPPSLGGGTLGELLERLRRAYCGTLTIELAPLEDPEIRRWWEERIEGEWPKPEPARRLQILRRLAEASLFEEYLQKKYLGSRTFSLEGNEALIPLLDFLLEGVARRGGNEVVLGMAHRGRLNVLTNVVGKPLEELFLEFEEALPESFTGDVKYHLGYSNDLETPAGQLHLSLNFNPSHLEYINPVAMGRVRAKQDRFGDVHRRRGMLVLIHGDAAFSGEGIVQETLNLAELPAYQVGGAIHIVVNNQLGFTTEPREYTSGQYCTDVAKMIQAPVLHLNAEDPDRLLEAVELILDFRFHFQKDVVLDLVGYRRRGHNETDEPSYTQPQMYALVSRRPQPYRLYAETLQAEGVLPPGGLEEELRRYQERLDAAFERAHTNPEPPRPRSGGGIWQPYRGGPETWEEVETGVPLERLQALADPLTRLPEGFHLHPRLGRFVEQRREMYQGRRPLDWASAEALAFATLAMEGHRVRLSGQDAVRGTFTQRHAGFVDTVSGETYLPLQHIAEGQAPVEVYNSPLSEAGVLGYEYGYSLDCPEGLVIWEAQYGDFANAAQVYIDQFIASGEVKWGRLSGLVLLLPHGLEGLGAEHSSARLERFLSLCAGDNLQVVYPTTPAQYFHLLRRQVLRPWRKPLVVMSPKSLLRHPEAVSDLTELTQGTFRRVIPEQVKNPKRILLTSGKIYYDLVAQRREANLKGVVILRLEQFYPFPLADLEAALAPFPTDLPIYWVQEEPANMGAWWFLKARFGEKLFGHPLLGVARPESPAPAGGSHKLHDRQQSELVRQALGL